MDELIRKKDALDALMAERKHLLDKGRWGAEHVLTHHGYNVIDELPPVQSDVPVINVGDMISRQAAVDALVGITMFKTKHELMQRVNASVQDEQGWLGAVAECLDEIEDLPSAQTELEDKIRAIGYTGKEGRIYIGGRLFAVRELAQ